ncbi:MAG: Flp pilus assembly complex ATPase component TadA [Burkholderiales bacterium]|nr:Flp pilus assembly complex ATPase component TadA [Burkholderiales bacterium]
MLIAEAVEKRASDIHLTLAADAEEGGLLVQFRLNGSLRIVREIKPWADGDAMLRAMFQGMAKVADSQVREGDDQHAVISDAVFLRTADGQELPLSGVRLARSVTVRGMNLAARLLYRRREDGQISAQGSARLARLGYCARHQRSYARLARETMGINLFTGPTGSGKSTTLAQQLRAIVDARNDIRVITMEDPVEDEFDHPSIWQYLINNANSDEEKSTAFAGKLKTALRQDPDVIMVGEIRGLEVAREAINASITGHPVWSTLHASDIFMAMPRLVGMGVDRFMLGDPTVLTSLTAQRLVKTVCPHCAATVGDIQEILPADEAKALRMWARRAPFLGDLSRVRVRREGGCKHCQGTGESGRTVVAHVVLTDDTLLAELLEHGAAVARRNYAARSDAEPDMMAHGALKVLSGLVDPRDLVQALGAIKPPCEEQRDLTKEDLLTEEELLKENNL